MKIITVASLKGGVGKSTTAIFLAHALKERLKQVLVIDSDPNNSLTDYFLKEADPRVIEKRNLYHILSGKAAVKDCIYLAGVDIIPCTLSLHGVGNEPRTNPASMHHFSKDLRNLDYDVIIIDTPPSPGYALRAALHASDLVLSPVGVSRWTMQALDILNGELLDVKNAMGYAPGLLAVPGMVTESEDEILRLSSFGDQLTYATIYHSDEIHKAATSGGVLKKGSKAGLDFENLAKEVV